MIIEDKIRDGKIHYYIEKRVAKISELLSDKIDKYEHLTVEEISPHDQSSIIEQAWFTYSPLGKASKNK